MGKIVAGVITTVVLIFIVIWCACGVAISLAGEIMEKEDSHAND